MDTQNGETTISTFEFFEMFPDEDAAIEYLEEVRWGEGMYCPHCDSERVTRLKAHPYWMCRDCRKKFTVRTDTVFARSHVPLHKWLYAMYLLETSGAGHPLVGFRMQVAAVASVSSPIQQGGTT